MIISKIMGGLGNQMFCYAAGRAVALRHGVEYVLDISGYPDDDGRTFELARYPLAARVSTQQEIESFLKYDKRRLHNKILNKLRFWRSYGQRKHFIQRSYAYDSEFQKIGPHARLDGLFQSECFFSAAADEIRRELKLKDDNLDDRNRELAQDMRLKESVSLHVRRTDYVQHERYSKIVEPCSLDYYRQAIAIVQKQVKDPHFFVFSDEPNWCRENLDLPTSSSIIDHNGSDKPWLDMHLMTCCRHHIVANSSFSWWGAWLAFHKDQLVIAPQSWLRPDSGLDDRDIVPSYWIKL